MKLIVGLGNPGVKYSNTRHNVGFMVVEAVARNQGLSWRYSQDWLGYWAKNGEIVLLKPSTYMNKSGVSVVAIAKFYKIEIGDILVIHDDVDLTFGKIRLSLERSSAGHKGVDSVIESLGQMAFGRLRVGVGRRKDGKKQDVEDYVLEEFSQDEKKLLAKIIEQGMRAVESFVESGVEAAMNKYN